MTKRSTLGALAALALAATAARPAQAQLDMNRYVWTTSTAASLAQGRGSTAIDMSTGTTQVFGSGAANVPGSTFQPIGFDLWFYGQRFSQFSVTPTGLVSLAEENLATTATLPGGVERFAAFHRAFNSAADATTLGPSATGKIHYKTTGTAPNRVLVVEFLNQGVLGGPGSTADATYQMRFYESSNVIEYVYGEMNIGTSGANKGFQVGINHNTVTTSNTYATVYVATSIPQARYNVTVFSGVNAQAAGPITALTSTSATQRRSYVFDPTATTPATTPTGLTVTPAGATLNVSFADGPDEIAYEVYYSTSSANFGLDPTAGANTADYGRVQVLSPTTPGPVTTTITGLRANTRYYVKVFALREALSAPAMATTSTVTAMRATAALQAAVDVYPNPSHGQPLLLDVRDARVQTWQLRDLKGRTVAQGRASLGKQQLNLPELTPGVYLLQVAAPTGTSQHRVVLQ